MLNVFQRHIVDAAGNVLPGASVTVRDQVTGQLVQLYSDYDGDEALGNPFTADEDGFVRFYAKTGRYRITAALNGTSRVWENETLGVLERDILYTRAVGDGVADDTAALAATFAQDRAVLAPGATYRVTSQINIDHPIVIEGNGAQIIADFGEAGSDYCISIAGAGTTATTTTCSSDLVEGERVVPVASASGFSIGDVVEIVSTEYFNGVTGVSGYTPKTKGELSRIRSISGDDITLDEPLKDNYTASGNTITVTKREHIAGVRIKNLGFYGTGGASGHTGGDNPTGARALRVNSAHDVTVTECSFENFPRFGLAIDFCTGVRVDGNEFDGFDITDNSNQPSGSVWFTGSTFLSCDGVLFTNNSGRNCRRICDFDTNTGRPVCRNIVIANNYAENCLNVIGTHACQRTIIKGNTGEGCGGIIYRGKDVTIIGNSCSLREGSAYSINVGSTSLAAYSEQTSVGNVVISGNVFNAPADSVERSVRVLANQDSLLIEGNKFPQTSGEAILIGGKQSRNIRINYNTLSSSGSTAVIYIPNLNAIPREVLDGVIITGNQFPVCGSAGIMIGGSSVESPADNIIICDNSFLDACSVAYIRLTETSPNSPGKYGIHKIIRDNIFPLPTPAAGDINASQQGAVVFRVSGNLHSNHGLTEIEPSTAALSGTNRTYLYGMWRWNTEGDAGDFAGWRCVVPGTDGTLSGVTGAINNTENTLTVSSVDDISVGTYLSVAGSGLTSAAHVVSMNGLVCTLSEAAGATVSGADVTYTAPTFKGFGEIEA